MQILVNGAWHEVHTAQRQPPWVSWATASARSPTAVNGEFVAAGARERTALSAGRPHRGARTDAGGLMLELYGTALRSRLLLGTARYSSPAVLQCCRARLGH